jgi:hypothetical protein
MTTKRTTRHDPASHLREASARWGGTSYKNAPTKSVSVGGTRFVYRELGIDSGVPVIFLNHLAANLDNWDPAHGDPRLGPREAGRPVGHPTARVGGQR